MPISLDSLSEEDRKLVVEEAARLTEMQKLEVTSSESWKSPRKEGFIIELPSGNVCRVKRTFSLLEMIKTGAIPNPLRTIVEESIEKGNLAIPLGTLTAEARIQAMDMVDATVISAMVEPRVIGVPEGVNPELFQAPPGAITIMDISIEDRMYISTVAQGGTTDVSKFREEQAQLVESLRSGETVGSAPERTPVPKRAKRSPSKKR